MAQISRTVELPHRNRFGRWGTTLLVVSGMLVLLLVLAACAGTDDSGTDPNTLATMEARKAPPPAATSEGGSATAETETGTQGTSAPEGNADQGKQLATSLGCVGCHSVDGSKLVGPSWKGLYGHEVKFTDGSTATADDAYIHQSIVDPNAKVVDGYQPVMPSFASQVDDQKIADIIAYIKTLQ